MSARPLGRSGLLAGLHVLVVDDDADSRDLIGMLVERAGARAQCVESVAGAMDAVGRSFDPDVVLTDYCMPGADGFELIREFRKVPSTRAVQVPILVITGHSEPGFGAKARAAGAADVVRKPFDPAGLVAWVAAAVADSGGGLRTLPS